MKKWLGGAMAPVFFAVGVWLVAQVAVAQPNPGGGPPPAGGPGGPPPSFESQDTDGDGKLSKQEFRGPEPAFSEFDTDKDGALTKEEFEAGINSMRERRRGPGAAPGAPPNEQSDTSFFSSTPKAKDDAEQKTLDVLTEMAKGGGRMQSVPMDDGRFLRLITESMDAKQVVEIGTSQGYSAIWFCLALRETGGKLTTYEIEKERAELAKANFEKAGVSGLVTLVVGDAHEEVQKLEGPIDILFLDADKQGYADYLSKLLPKVRAGGLVIAHNITAGMADPKFVEAITTNPELESLLVRLQSGGISVSMKKR